jgi:peptidoglycan hydrolase-like protein with peptidoglycan-binding domain
MELAAYLHSEFTQTQFEQGIEIAPELDCGLIEAIAKSASSSKVGLCLTFATFSVIATLGSAFGVAANSQTSSSDMRYVQTLLSNNGFDPGPIDGVKGSATKEAIIRAQKAFGLDADGVAGSQTMAALEKRAPATSSTTNISLKSDSQSSVMNLQKLLTDRGFFNSPVTGVYGPITKDAVIAAQKAYGLTPDGIAGEKTMAALESDSAAVVPISTTDVTALQKLLSDRGFYMGAIDGIMGAQTKAAIIAAQKAYGLTPDGIAGPQTMAALQGGSPSRGQTTSDANVTELQKLLASRGFYTGAIDGIMGAQTKAAVTAAQKSYGLNPDGIAGSQTMAALKKGTSTVSVKPTPTPATTPIAAPSKAVVTTTSSDGVANLQNLLKDRGFYDGPISGILGPRTRTAIITAQKAYGLNPDGIAGAQTIAALESRAPAPKPATPQPISVAPTPQPVVQPAPQPIPIPQPQPVATPKPTPVATATTPPTVQPAPSVPFTRSASVAEIQQLLAQRGFYTGASDGVLSNETKNAILRAQNFYALTPADGNPSAALVDSLRKDPFVVGGN